MNALCYNIEWEFGKIWLVYINFVFQRSVASVITLTPPALTLVLLCLFYQLRSTKGQRRCRVEDGRDVGLKEGCWQCLSRPIAGLWGRYWLYFIDYPVIRGRSICNEKCRNVRLRSMFFVNSKIHPYFRHFKGAEGLCTIEIWHITV